MKKTVFKTIVILMTLYSSVIAQNNKIAKEDINKTAKQIGNSLPTGWTTKIDTAYYNEFVIQSTSIDLVPDMTSNDPPFLEGQCEIFILIIPKISSDSISIVRNKNKELQKNLSPQNSKNNLQNWYKQNEKTLKIIDSEPTHYDKNYSYRIKCRRLPKNEKDITEYNKIMNYLNRQFEKY